MTLLRCELRGGPELFEGGIASDLANNVQVEAEGSWDQFTTNVGAGRSVIIQTDSLTTGSLPQVGTPCVQVRGQRSGLATPPVGTAGEIRTSCSNSDRPFMQAPVEAETSTSVTLLGFAIDVSNAQWEDINGQPIPTLAAFLNAITPATTNAAGVSVGGTLVKVTFDSGTNLVRQAEIED